MHEVISYWLDEVNSTGNHPTWDWRAAFLQYCNDLKADPEMKCMYTQDDYSLPSEYLTDSSGVLLVGLVEIHE